MVAAVALAAVVAALVAAWFAGEAKDAKVELAKVNQQLAALQVIQEQAAKARTDEVTRLRAVLEAYKREVDEKELLIANSHDPNVLREHLRSLGRVLHVVPGKDPDDSGAG